MSGPAQPPAAAVGVLTVPAPAGIPLARRPRRRTSVAVAAAKAHRIVLDESLSVGARSDPRQGTLLGPGAGGWTRCRARPRGRGLRQGPRGADTPIEAGGATTGSGDHCFDSEM